MNIATGSMHAEGPCAELVARLQPKDYEKTSVDIPGFDALFHRTELHKHLPRNFCLVKFLAQSELWREQYMSYVGIKSMI